MKVADEARLTSAVPSVCRHVCCARPPMQRRKVAIANCRLDGAVPSLTQRTVKRSPPSRLVDATGLAMATSAAA